VAARPGGGVHGEVGQPVGGPVGGQHVLQQVGVDAAVGEGGVGAAVAAVGAGGQGEVGDSGHRRWAARPVEQVEQPVGSGGQAVVDVVAEAVQVVLVLAGWLRDTCGGGHLVIS